MKNSSDEASNGGMKYILQDLTRIYALLGEEQSQKSIARSIGLLCSLVADSVSSLLAQVCISFFYENIRMLAEFLRRGRPVAYRVTGSRVRLTREMRLHPCVCSVRPVAFKGILYSMVNSDLLVLLWCTFPQNSPSPFQVWLPERDPETGRTYLVTRNLPFSVLGSGDQLALYR